MLKRYLRYLNYAAELRTIAEEGTHEAARDTLITLAAEYDRMATSLNSILRTRAALEGSTSPPVEPASGLRP